jgi:hypothetical protein
VAEWPKAAPRKACYTTPVAFREQKLVLFNDGCTSSNMKKIKLLQTWAARHDLCSGMPDLGAKALTVTAILRWALGQGSKPSLPPPKVLHMERVRSPCEGKKETETRDDNISAKVSWRTRGSGCYHDPVTERPASFGLLDTTNSCRP